MPRIRPDDSGPNPVDIYIGAKVKARRLVMGLSQTDLADAIGLTFQQIQKYERGVNRISVSRLVDICKVLKVHIDYFFDDASPVAKVSGKKYLSEARLESEEVDALLRKDIMALVRAYSSIKSPQLRKQILEMAKTLSGQ